MTWTYDIATDVGKVRFAIGDTDTTDQQLSNEEISYLITLAGSVAQAGVQAARAVAAKYARLVNSSVESVSESAEQRFQHYSQLAGQLASAAASTGTVLPYVGGVSVSRMVARESNPDRPLDAFRDGAFDNPLAGPQNE